MNTGDLRVTFVTPHQRPTSGGVYAIEQFAEHLAGEFEVRLLVRKGELRAIPNVAVQAFRRVAEDEVPDGDVILLPADSGDGEAFMELPPSKGAKHVLFQGFGAIGNPVVVDNLQRDVGVLATAAWLVDEATDRGRTAQLVPYGVDTALFHDAHGEARDPHLVSMMTHHLDWKGTPEGVRALEIVRRSVPDCRVELFGVEDPGLDGAHFHESLGRDDVGRLFRRSAVFVCSSWEEGFGMPGLEAIACGAALATTDTKGSRDYAIDGETALVSTPRSPEALAASIVRLLKDGEFRAALTARGQRFVARKFGTWDDAAKRFGRRLRTVR